MTSEESEKFDEAKVTSAPGTFKRPAKRIKEGKRAKKTRDREREERKDCACRENNSEEPRTQLATPLLKLLEIFACTSMLPATFIMIF